MLFFGKPNVDKMERERNIEGLIRALAYRKDGLRSISGSAARALGRIGAPAVASLIAALQDADSDVRFYAAIGLGGTGDARAVDPLIAALQDADRTVRFYAAEALGKLGDARAVLPLVAVLGERETTAPCAAAEALGVLGDVRAVEGLIALMKNGDGHPVARYQSAAALGKLGDTRAVEPLMAALRWGDADLRAKAGEALGRLCDARAVEPLVAALQDKEPKVREAVTKALADLGQAGAAGPEALEALTRYRAGGMREASGSETSSTNLDALLGLKPRPPHLLKLLKLPPQTGIAMLKNGEAFDFYTDAGMQERFDPKDYAAADMQWAEDVLKVGVAAQEKAESGRFAEAIPLLQKALQMAPGYDMALLSLGVCYAETRQFPQALKTLQTAATLHPENERIRRNLEAIRRAAKG